MKKMMKFVALCLVGLAGVTAACPSPAIPANHLYCNGAALAASWLPASGSVTTVCPQYNGATLLQFGSGFTQFGLVGWKPAAPTCSPNNYITFARVSGDSPQKTTSYNMLDGGITYHVTISAGLNGDIQVGVYRMP